MASLDAHLVVRDYLGLAYAFDEKGVAKLPPSPEMEEFMETENQLIDTVVASGVARKHVEGALTVGEMRLFCREIGGWKHEFWSVFGGESPSLHHAISSEKWLGKDKVVRLSFDKTLGEAASVFASALVICELLAKPGSVMARVREPGVSVVELGSGTGVWGLVAGMLGVNVTMTDKESVLPQIRENVRKNVGDSEAASNIKIEALEWGTPTSIQSDVVVCSDCIYHTSFYAPLVTSLVSLCHPQSIVYLTFERRNEANEQRFLTMLEDHFIVNEELCATELVADVRLFTLLPHPKAQ